MHTVTVTVAALPVSFPAGTQPAGIKVTLGTLAPVVVAAAPYAATFSDVPAGDYPISAQTVDVSGNALGDAVTASVTVAPDTVQVDIPASISVQVS